MQEVSRETLQLFFNFCVCQSKGIQYIDVSRETMIFYVKQTKIKLN